MSIRELELETLSEMAMVDIVYHLLKESNKQPMAFHQLLDEVMALKGIAEQDKLDVMSRLYTEINIDGRFRALGDNVWGLRSWYPVEQAEEIVITDVKKKAKKKRLEDDEDGDYLDEDLDDLDEEDIDDLDDLDEDDLDDYDELDDLDDLDDIDDDLEEELDDDSIDSDLDDDLDEDLDEDLDDLDENEDEDV